MILYGIDWTILDGVGYPGCNTVESVNVLLLPRVMLPASLNATPISGFGHVICLDTSV